MNPLNMRAYNNRDKRKYKELSYESKYLLDPNYMTKRDMQYYYRYVNMKNGRSQFKNIVVILFLICFFSYVFLAFNVKGRFDLIERIDADYNITKSYFVDTSGCRMPHFEVTDDNILQFVTRPHSFKCTKPLTKTLNEGSHIVLNILDHLELRKLYNISDLSEVYCNYTEITRKTDKQNEYGQVMPFKLHVNESVTVKEGIEFVRVNCHNKKGDNIYNDYHFFVVDKSDKSGVTPETDSNGTTAVSESFERGYLRNRSNNSNLLDKSKKFSKNSKKYKNEQLSVMLLGIDTLSHLNFLRQMKKSAHFIKSQLTHVDFWGFNKVGDNTYPNLIPLFSGLDVNEFNISCMTTPKHSYFDNCSFIWKRFKDAGFKTVYAEDVANLALFNRWGTGFTKQPTDYYLRPIMLEMERHIADKKYVNVKLCMGGRCTADVLLEYAQKFIPLMRQQRFFSFFWTLTITHDDFNMPVLLDKKLLKLMQAYEESGIFNNTIIFLLSDHGLRWGSFRNTYQGMIEERQPLLMALYPQWMKKKFPMAIANLELNAKRLTTHFDLHATLQDLLNLHNLKDKEIATRTADLADSEVLPRGISLFLPIPESRTCENAGIAAHWCCCYQRTEMETNNGRVQRAARYIVKLINDRIKQYPQCRTLYLNSIMKGYLSAPHHKIIKDVTNDYAVDITLRIQTKPGLGIYESTVRMSSYSTALTGTISRINLYASQSYCIDDYATKMFCYCHR